MHTQSNPQQPASTATTADLPETPIITSEATTAAATIKPEPMKTKTPDAKIAQPSRRTTSTSAQKPATKDRQPEKTAEKAQNTKPATTAPAKAPREGSTMWAVLKVLDSAKEPLSAKDIYAQIAERKLAPGLKGKTPDQTIAAKLAVSAKNGEYVERTAPGKFQLIKERS